MIFSEFQMDVGDGNSNVFFTFSESFGVTGDFLRAFKWILVNNFHIYLVRF
jgi:hypothetical protein